MWEKSEKSVVFGLGYSIWACVFPGATLMSTILGIALAIIGFCYFAASFYQSFKED